MSDFLLEVGTEDLPAGFVSDAIRQWEKMIPASLTAEALSYSSVEIYATPRRLSAIITNLPDRQVDRVEEIKGPPAAAAYKDGQPTPAAIGFAKKQGVDVSSLELRPTDKGEFIFITKTIAGRDTTEILTESIPQWIFKLEGKRLMRWANGELKFPRPIRWLVALWNESILPIEIVNGEDVVTSDRISHVHRVLHPQPVSVVSAPQYLKTLADGFVNVDQNQRKADIQQQIQAAATHMGGVAEVYPDLLAEVVNLVEYPTAVVGKFDDEFLDLPPEVITTVMVTHQRYFPIFTDASKQKLLPHFITISNGDPAKSDIIAAGNGRVVRARLADGQYFYQADLAQPLADYLPKLDTVTFQADLGSVQLKVDRIVKNANSIASQLNLTPDQCQNIDRAALLCKADLVTQMVGEFPELQGIMGSKYAIANGETPAVATAILEHYLPRNAEDSLPQTLTGQIVGIADRLDTLVCIFGLGMLPTGSSDPFALRRAANAIVNIVWNANLGINLEQLIDRIVSEFSQIRTQVNTAELTQQLQDFFIQRLRNLLQEDRQIDYDLVNAILGENDREYTQRALTDLLDTRDRAIFLQQIRDNGTLESIYATVNRSSKLAAQGNLDTQQLAPTHVIQTNLFQKSSEQAVYDGLIALEPQTNAAKASRNYQQLIDALAQLTPAIGNFFDGEDSVLIMDSNPDIKTNRLNLLGLVRNHARVLADFGSIVK
ncbi:glycine--tRNA ligase subunit beta [Chamaesiphon minutus]|uniref:Glycine--tRNA ligase beta subunit n=1 Tax=Chamaesiphon minutus (strain ATCC 27169 / PCC 6605) TaxID=1173020 RepID=K9UN11_CHAP6|nr:glycine--tRNA ligase subunit beta [Chamaesiphon minutus]AFY96205.1 glycyl-tRNA synthetase, tetrameric type, beta subunit [Chamaesiphon minutus PCC 6605]